MSTGINYPKYDPDRVENDEDDEELDKKLLNQNTIQHFDDLDQKFDNEIEKCQEQNIKSIYRDLTRRKKQYKQASKILQKLIDKQPKYQKLSAESRQIFHIKSSKLLTKINNMKNDDDYKSKKYKKLRRQQLKEDIKKELSTTGYEKPIVENVLSLVELNQQYLYLFEITLSCIVLIISSIIVIITKPFKNRKYRKIPYFFIALVIIVWLIYYFVPINWSWSP